MRPAHLMILSQLRTVWSDLLGAGICLVALVCLAGTTLAAAAGPPDGADGEMTEAEAARLGEEFGVVVGPVDEEIRKELKLVRPEGVVVFEVIGGTRADLAGIKVRAVIKEIDKTDIKNMIEFGNALKRAMKQCDFTVGTYEPADPGDPVGWGVNFHFVGCKRD